MTLLNTADAIYLGGVAADRVYLGATQVWPASAGDAGLVQIVPYENFGDQLGTGDTYTVAPEDAFTPGNYCVFTSTNYLDSGINGRVKTVHFGGTLAVKSVEHSDAAFSDCIWGGEVGSDGTGCVVTLEGVALQFSAGAIMERSDVDTSDPLDATNTATGNSTAPTVGVASIEQPRELIVAVIGGQNGENDTLTVPADYVELYVQSDGVNLVPGAAAYKIVSATGAQTAAFSRVDAHDWQAVMATFKLN